KMRRNRFARRHRKKCSACRRRRGPAGGIGFDRVCLKYLKRQGASGQIRHREEFGGTISFEEITPESAKRMIEHYIGRNKGLISMIWGLFALCAGCSPASLAENAVVSTPDN